MKAIASCCVILMTVVLNLAPRFSNDTTKASGFSVADQVCALPGKLDATTLNVNPMIHQMEKAVVVAEAKEEGKPAPKILANDDTDPFGQKPLLAQAPSRSGCANGACSTGKCASGQCGQSKQQQAVTLLPNGAPVRNVQSGCNSGGCGSSQGCNSGGCSGGRRRLIRR